MKTLMDKDCSVGDYAVAFNNGDSGWSFTFYPDYDAAEHFAKTDAKQRAGKAIFIVQVCGEFKAVAEVFEVRK